MPLRSMKDEVAVREILGLSLVLLLGCATTERSVSSTEVRKDMILPSGAIREKLSANAVFLAPVPILESMPEFPADYPADVDADVSICAELTISADGIVMSVEQISSSPGCEPAGSKPSQLLYPKVASTLRHWTYFGAAICHYTSNESECGGSHARHVALPVKLAYRFNFKTIQGRRVVQRTST